MLIEKQVINKQSPIGATCKNDVVHGSYGRESHNTNTLQYYQHKTAQPFKINPGEVETLQARVGLE